MSELTDFLPTTPSDLTPAAKPATGKEAVLAQIKGHADTAQQAAQEARQAANDAREVLEEGADEAARLMTGAAQALASAADRLTAGTIQAMPAEVDKKVLVAIGLHAATKVLERMEPPAPECPLVSVALLAAVAGLVGGVVGGLVIKLALSGG
jgi:hypothetical protein